MRKTLNEQLNWRYATKKMDPTRTVAQEKIEAIIEAIPLRYHRRWRGGRVVEGAPLLREYAVIPHRGFESLPLRHTKRIRLPEGARAGRDGGASSKA